ncbi:hypothetical protein N658DRAFT_316734 [Parathielavia hyrcaniae]|uniref:Uncharacterized protein n=1 Tax=Parathielavia hyrcaniae TaxID=113614 RepID=A0AAN6PSJ0_9PEZI|nr:hypothetical protein N658DRAFT_316734 [Parathielavia hyrcaniae]
MWKRFKTGSSTFLNGALPQTSVEEVSTPALSSPRQDQLQHSSHSDENSKFETGIPPSRRPSTLPSIRTRFSSLSQRTQTQDRNTDPQGLVVLHAPQERTVDILFIHGLGGTSLRTWCHERQLENLWPQLWLPDELPTARILTFGYNARFNSTTERGPSTLGDFAAELLFRMNLQKGLPTGPSE